MPIGSYFHGGGNDVMSNLTREYGPDKGKHIFYALANKRHAKPMATGGIIDPYRRRFPWSPDDQQDGEMPPPPPPMPMAGDQQEPVPPQMPDSASPPPPMPEAPPQMASVAPQRQPMPTMPDQQQGPPPPPDALGRDPMYRRGLMVAREQQDQMPPPYPAGRIQGSATQQYLDEAQRLAGKKPSMLQNIAGGLLGATRFRNIDVHPNLTRERQNLGLLKGRADEERQIQQAQSGEDIKRDTLATNAEIRRSQVAQREALAKPLQTLQQKLDEALQAGYSPDEAKLIAAGWKPPAEKAAPRPIVSAPGSDVLDPKDPTKVLHSTPAREVADKQNPNEWIADSLDSDPAISGPAKQKLAAYKASHPAQSTVSVNMSDSALDQAAARYLKSGELPPMGMGRDAGASRTRILNRAAELDPSADISGNKAGYGSDKGSLGKLQATRDSINAFEGTARKNLDQFLNIAQKTVDSGMPWANRAFRGGARALGDPNAAQFEAARTVAFTEIAKVLNNPTSSAVLSDSARKEAETVLNGNYTVPQLMDVAKLLKQDMENRKVETDRALSEIRERMSGKKPTIEAAAQANPNPNGYVAGHVYGGMTYLGGDPNNPASWKK